MEPKTREEDALRKSIAANPERQKMYGERLGRDRQGASGICLPTSRTKNLRSSCRLQQHFVYYARTLVRLAAESEKPNAQRLPEFTTRVALRLRSRSIHRTDS